jgi:molecular chaperone DnaK
MANEPFAVGIDLGTSTSEICVYRNNEPMMVPDPGARTKSPIVPSLVAVNRRGELVVGEDARPYVDLPGRGVREVKRLMGTGELVTLGDRDCRPEEISALILRRLKENAEEAVGQPILDVVLSVPANFPDAARQATLEAGRLAGLNILRLINEPTAAAMAFGHRHIEVEGQLVVFDFGGGTLDITVLEMIAGVLDVKSSFGNTRLGGKDFDDVMVNLILRKFQEEHRVHLQQERCRQTLKAPAELAKIALSNSSSYLVVVPNFTVRDGIPIDLEVEVTREEYNHACAHLLEAARACVRQALNAKQLLPEMIDKVLLVGGTTYIPAVRQLVAEMFSREPRSEVNPDLAVAMGASVQAAIIKELIDPGQGDLIVTDVSPFGLGIDVVSNVGGQMMLLYEPLILPNTTIPFTVKRSYRLLSGSQGEAEISLYQDHTGKARLPEEAIFTGIKGSITDIPPSPNGEPHEVEIEFSYDTNGLAKLTAKIHATGQKIEFHYQPSAQRLSDEEKEEAFQNVRDLWKQSARAKEYDTLITKADRLMGSVPDVDKRQQLTLAVSDLKMALVSNNDTDISRAGDKLVDLLFEIEDILGR